MICSHFFFLLQWFSNSVVKCFWVVFAHVQACANICHSINIQSSCKHEPATKMFSNLNVTQVLFLWFFFWDQSVSASVESLFVIRFEMIFDIFSLLAFNLVSGCTMEFVITLPFFMLTSGYKKEQDFQLYFECVFHFFFCPWFYWNLFSILFYIHAIFLAMLSITIFFSLQPRYLVTPISFVMSISIYVHIVLLAMSWAKEFPNSMEKKKNILLNHIPLNFIFAPH